MLFTRLSKNVLLGCCLLVTVVAVVVIRPLFTNTDQPFKTVIPQPTEGEENEKLREKYEALRHRTKDGSNWRITEARNLAALKAKLQSRPITFGLENFANGAISGEWQERGARNITGNVRAIDYVPLTNTFYNISNGGSLWSSVQGSGNWVLRNQSYRFEPRTIRAFTKTGGGTRLLLATDLNVYYSDNEGQTINPSTGISFPVEWGGNYIADLIRLNDAGNTIYCLARPWSSSPWGPRFWLYRSTNQGQSFTKIVEFDAGDDDRLSLCNPYNSNLLYAADISSVPGSVKLYKITGASVTVVNTATALSATGCLLKGTSIGGTLSLYALLNNNQVWKSTNEGQSWAKQSDLPEDAWMKMNVSPADANQLAYGGVNAYRSSNGGLSWTQINSWSEYYGNIPAKLHADIMEIEYFKKTDNTVFTVVNTHGGCYTSYDNLVTVANQSQSTHLATEYYDVVTDTLHPERIYSGTQDQGLQRTLTADQPGLRDFTQLISGDYGHLCLTKNGEIIWPQYPGGTFYCFTNLGAVSPDYITSWTMGGSEKPNVGWMLATRPTVNAAANEIWMGGGNVNGGGGSYLSKLIMANAPFYTITPIQLDYDFRANSNNGTSGISAIEQSVVNPNKLFVATEDGSFFYSGNLGSSWTKTATFNGPGTWYLYGSCILASHRNEQTIWYAGSGYGSPPVFKSVDGGASFTSMSAGMPSTLVNDLVASPDEKFLFAATEAGPYVYVAASNQWYSLASTAVPLQFYSSVEFITAENTVRFGTMGRGIFDFKMVDASKIYTFNGNGNWDVNSNWQNQKRPPATLGKGEEIIVNPPANGQAVLNIKQRVGAGAKFSVTAGKKLTLPLGLSIYQDTAAALSFDGMNDYVRIPSNPLLKPTAGITFEAWVNASDIHSIKNCEVYRKEDGNSRHLFSFQQFGKVLSFGLQAGGNYVQLDAPVSPADFEGKWVHIAATYDGSIRKIYMDGMLIASANSTGAIGTAGNANAFIGSLNGTSEFFKGAIDEFKLFNRALTATEIQAGMHCEYKTLPAGLVLYYKFNQGAAGGLNTNLVMLPDAGVNKINGTLVNFNLTGNTSNWVAPGGVLSGSFCQ